MLERIIAQTLKQRGFVVLALAVAAAAGALSLSRLPIDAFPDMTSVQVEIVALAPGLASDEIERFVTSRIEMSLRGLPGLVQLRSVTKFGIAVLTMVFTDGTDIYFARQLVFQRLSEAEKNLPPGVDCEMGPVATAMGEIFHYTLEKEGGEEASVKSLTDLRTLQDWVVAPLLKNIPGVSEVNSFGGYVKQYQVEVIPDKLNKYGLGILDVAAALEKNNENVGGGLIERHSEQFIVRGLGLLRGMGDIQGITLKSHAGTPVLLGDVAEVKTGQFGRQGAAYKNGQNEVVGGVVMMLRGENSRQVVELVARRAREINAGGVLPSGIKIIPYYQRSQIIENSIATVTTALAEGALFVMIILFLFLRNLRGALIVLLALPLSLLLTFTVMGRAGIEANLMSLGGLAISIGMIIDATIIQVENVQRRLGDAAPGCPKIKTVLGAVLEVRKPSIFGELIIAITFIPIFSLQGMEGKMFRPLAATVGIALLASLLLSIFAIPALCATILSPAAEKESILVRAARKVYLPLLRFTLKRKGPVLAVLAVLLAAAISLVPRLGSEFMPVMDEGAFDMDVQMLPGVSLEQSLATNRLIQQKLLSFPELDSVVARTGQSGIALEAKGVDKTGYTGSLKPRRLWRRGLTREKLFNQMRSVLATVPGMVYGFSQPIQCRIDELMAGTRSQLIIKLFGDDIAVLKAGAEEIADAVRDIPGCADLVVERISGQPTVTIAVDRARIARYGLDACAVLDTFAAAIGGRIATQIYEENRFFDCIVRFPEEKRDAPEKIAALLVPLPDGRSIPLGQLADIRSEEGPVQISREDGQRRIGIELNVTGRDIGRFVAEAKKRIRQKVKLPPGYYLSWGGQFENQRRAAERLAIIAPSAVLLILLLLFLTFNSLRQALLVLLNLPFALIGGVIALAVSGQYLSVPASIGFIVLFGVAVLNGVVLISHINQERQRGTGLDEAVIRGCAGRLRPVLMTAVISVFGLIPMLFASGPGSEIQKPLATVVAGGLATSTLLTLLILPVVYSISERKNREKCK